MIFYDLCWNNIGAIVQLQRKITLDRQGLL